MTEDFVITFGSGRDWLCNGRLNVRGGIWHLMSEDFVVTILCGRD